MLLKFASTVLFITALLVGTASVAFCQSDSGLNPKPAQNNSNDEELAGSVSVNAVTKLIKEKKLDLAAKMIDAGVEQASADGNNELQRLRFDLVRGFGRDRQFSKAYTQGEKYIRSQLEIGGVGGANAAFSALSRIVRYANRSDQTASGLKLAMDTMAKAEQVTAGNRTQFFRVMQSLVPVVVAQATANGDEELADKIATEKLAELDALETQQQPSVEYLIAKMKILKSQVELPNSTEESAADFKKFIDDANAIYPDSLPLLTAYMRAETFMIGQLVDNYPRQAKTRVDALRELVKENKDANSALRSLPGTLRSYELMIGDALQLQKMVGQEPAEFEVETWINSDELTLESLKGKVVMLDFWAVWCGPCIKSFPFMRRLHEELKDDGLAVIGVTTRYDFRWDDQKKLAYSADGKVPVDEETEDTKKFVAYHQLEYPVIITPKDGKMMDNYKAFALPHVVIIDREGKIQLARVGAGKGAHEQIESKIKELLKK